MGRITQRASNSNRCTLIANVMLNAAKHGFFNAKDGKIGLWTAAALNAIFDDFGGRMAP